jgi:hypothetical protein
MNTVSEAKTPARNRLEGFMLSVIFLGVPTYAAVVLMLKLFGSHQVIVGSPGAAIFVVLTSLFHALIMPSLWKRFPNFIRHGHEPLFYDARLLFSDKIARWHSQPAVSAQLATTAITLSLLAIGVVCFR